MTFNHVVFRHIIFQLCLWLCPDSRKENGTKVHIIQTYITSDVRNIFSGRDVIRPLEGAVPAACDDGRSTSITSRCYDYTSVS